MNTVYDFMSDIDIENYRDNSHTDLDRSLDYIPDGPVKVRDLNKGDFFTKKQIEYPADRQVWVRGDYDRAEKRYECYRFDDVNTYCYIPGEKEVYTDFTF